MLSVDLSHPTSDQYRDRAVPEDECVLGDANCDYVAMTYWAFLRVNNVKLGIVNLSERT